MKTTRCPCYSLELSSEFSQDAFVVPNRTAAGYGFKCPGFFLQALFYCWGRLGTTIQ